MAKKQFAFYQDVKVTTWERQTFFIEAESFDEAKEIAKGMKDKDVSSVLSNCSKKQTLYGSKENVNPSENNGKPTKIMYSTDDLSEPLCTNIQQ